MIWKYEKLKNENHNFSGIPLQLWRNYDYPYSGWDYYLKIKCVPCFEDSEIWLHIAGFLIATNQKKYSSWIREISVHNIIQSKALKMIRTCNPNCITCQLFIRNMYQKHYICDLIHIECACNQEPVDPCTIKQIRMEKELYENGEKTEYIPTKKMIRTSIL